jgi:hypothetical protein
METEYAKGFDAGVDVVLLEIELWIKEREHEPRKNWPKDLLAHLKLENKDPKKLLGID